MPAKKDDPMSATHFTCNHHTAAGSKGSVVTVEKLNDTFGRNDKHTDEQHAKYLQESLKRLLDLGAITPAEAPDASDGSEAEEAAKKAEERRKADEDAAKKAAAAKHPEPPKK